MTEKKECKVQVCLFVYYPYNLLYWRNLCFSHKKCIVFFYILLQSIREDTLCMLSTENSAKIPANNAFKVTGKTICIIKYLLVESSKLGRNEVRFRGEPVKHIIVPFLQKSIAKQEFYRLNKLTSAFLSFFVESFYVKIPQTQDKMEKEN